MLSPEYLKEMRESQKPMYITPASRRELEALGIWDYVSNLGLNIIVEDPNESDEPIRIICTAPPKMLMDDVLDSCSLCGSSIIHRPTIPLLAKCICIPCSRKENP